MLPSVLIFAVRMMPKDFPLTVKALHAAPDLGPAFIKELAGLCGHGSLRLKEVNMCTH